MIRSRLLRELTPAGRAARVRIRFANPSNEGFKSNQIPLPVQTQRVPMGPFVFELAEREGFEPSMGFWPILP